MALPCKDLVTRTLQNFIELTERPEVFLSVQEKLYRQFRDATKGVYDLSKSSESQHRAAADSSLPELIIQNFDEEQIWQELELQNSFTVDGLMSKIPSLTVHRIIVFSPKHVFNFTKSRDVKIHLNNARGNQFLSSGK
ncbi:U3 small nucleolar ribonucleoprotein protein MPP10-like [Argopecten irradians]|uniref:U3 small nucleolar ribonucleoprotein protein MPP10-like n=1 Tax=Argopecten irradians TaxID=31199 RepID=UPI00371495C4